MAQLSERVAAELVRIHRPTHYYQGLTPAGELHLIAGGAIGPNPDDMPSDIGCNRYSCCITCRTRSEPGRDQWPCETVALLVEAGLVPRLESSDAMHDSGPYSRPRADIRDVAADG